MDMTRFRKKPVMGILRGVSRDALEPLIETVISAGLETLEITMNTEGAASLISDAVRTAKGRLMLGAGTVLTKDAMNKALDAGATFIVMPVLVPEVVEACVRKKVPVFPGAFTPQEIFNAWKAGATMVKLFPAKFLGPSYIKEIKGPFNEIELLACGGITPLTIREYLIAGASAVTFGASVFKKEWLEKGDFTSIGKGIKELIEYYAK
ncbi:MAG: bifunctional 4-hydroxy-2-oxoglutarate aldolase/2-dehydro-3-deoxy-phosphogluconate aldolase [Candidatus Omnitrophica bacterium]|nr:bifunctional 4-hydroxy-2-oxoglutarate aldolase/2-dehydro-3-deoxy-phosphogluconate aldolase [Candidatus Omnitrophota bacterium]MBU4488490.1 bifunctional 4-hydroxy-2-oxoglutarate aldolase/2-dehydro-3-deoxy-phosphogluconate aldolase [Candidatus Omnitrophota bacterium]MCG2704598.1 bifunctional 4-hydroxy-2-oxoglutarate aldolase/2-dehydro-3-deoxy-phosphogluconate aldolase [Candidatus Omnitrophota bacterium]